MEKLPIEMVASIAQHLTVEELLTCCAVCKWWREAFSQDILWKPRCDLTIAKHLQTTECAVEPRFVHPLPEDSSLGPLGEWRINFMRQVHLWANWRLGRSVRLQFDNCEFSHPLCTFLTNDLVLKIYGNSVSVWNVNSSPQYFEPMRLFAQWDVDMCRVFSEDKLVVVQNSAVLVFTYDIYSTEWPLEYVFFFNESEKRSSNNLEELGAHSMNEEENYSTKFAVVGSVLVGCQKNEEILHIWNLETGKKLKEEALPISVKYNIKELEHSKTSEDILVAGHEESGSIINFFVYSLSQLTFLPFREKHKTYNNGVSKSCIHGDYVAIRINLNLYIHNYQNCQLIKTINTVVSNPQVLNNIFVYIQNPQLFGMHPFNTLTAFNPCAPNATLFLTRQNVQRFLVIGGKFYMYDKHLRETVSSGDSDTGSETWKNLRSSKSKQPLTDYFERKVWEIHRKQGPKKTKTRVFWFRETANVIANETCTRVISSNLTNHLSGEEQYWLHTFW